MMCPQGQDLPATPSYTTRAALLQLLPPTSRPPRQLTAGSQAAAATLLHQGARPILAGGGALAGVVALVGVVL